MTQNTATARAAVMAAALAVVMLGIPLVVTNAATATEPVPTLSPAPVRPRTIVLAGTYSACDEPYDRGCVYEDDGGYMISPAPWVAVWLLACETEDSPWCVWDSATQGNRSQSADSATRYTVNGADD